jgi:hypothetical protein
VCYYTPMNGRVLAGMTLVLAVAGCRKPPAVPASKAECETACERVAGLQRAPKVAETRVRLHELDEHTDTVEADSKRAVQQLTEELAMGGPPWDPKPFATMPAATRRELAERHEWEVRQLKLQRESALKVAREAPAIAHKAYEDATAQADADEKQAHLQVAKECADACVQKTQEFAQCLQRTQALEDIQLCSGK